MAEISRQARERWEAEGMTEQEMAKMIDETVEEARAERRQRNAELK